MGGNGYPGGYPPFLRGISSTRGGGGSIIGRRSRGSRELGTPNKVNSFFTLLEQKKKKKKRKMKDGNGPRERRFPGVLLVLQRRVP